MNIALSMNEYPKINVGDTVKKYSRQLFSFIRDKTKTIEDAEDILQEVWYQFSRLASIDELENINAWLFSVSRNKITDLYRKKKTDNLEDHSYEDDEGNFEIKDILLLDDSQNPELSFFKNYFWDVFMKALNELPENQKQVFIENEMEDKTLQEIADATNENIKTIISRKGYAVKHLRKRLQELYEEFNNF